MTGAITAATNNQGTVEVNNTLGSGTAVTFSGALGTSGNRLGGLTLTAGNTAFTGERVCSDAEPYGGGGGL